MAAANPIWANITPNNTDILGPSYDYSANIPGPNSLGVGSDGSFSQIGSNMNAVTTYIKTLITGDPPLGNQYFVNTGGQCICGQDGSTQNRYNYINNKSTGKDLIPQGLNDLSFLSSDLNGIIPGIVGDIEGLDPAYLFTSLMESGTPSCDCYTCTTTDGSVSSRFMSPNLSPDFDTNLCSKVDMSVCTKEGFYGGSANAGGSARVSSTMSEGVGVAIAIGAILMLIGLK